jgi:hypothetical protein
MKLIEIQGYTPCIQCNLLMDFFINLLTMKSKHEYSPGQTIIHFASRGNYKFDRIVVHDFDNNIAKITKIS